MNPTEVLKQTFGHSAFRPGQEKLVSAILAGRDVLGVMPTGGGKSVCYQVPGLLLPGVTLVVSPLISLMKDQVAALKEAGVSAAYINSSLTPGQLRLVYSRVREGWYKIIYVAPERLEGEGFAAIFQSVQVSLLAVDEAHCISQWGQDFRPSYLKISEFADALPRRPVVAAFTATATAEVRTDIVRLLRLSSPECEITGFDRPNLFFDVQHPKKKADTLLALVRKRRGKSGIVYCATRASVEKICAMLCTNGVDATRYHAGLPDEERQRNQDDFRFDRKDVMVATNAFGMGIDKSNVSFVFHYNMPKSLEAYYQEAGRAGRDGEKADCILLFSPGDIATAKFLLANSGNESLTAEEQAVVQQQEQKRLQVMIDYCKTTACLRGFILSYFGQPHQENCGSCGNCRGQYKSEDITKEAQMVLSCVLRVKEQLGYALGRTMIVQVLRGSREQRLLDLALNTLSTYGLMQGKSVAQVQDVIDALLQNGALWVNPAHNTLEAGENARDVLQGKAQVVLNTRADRAEEAPKKTASPRDGGLYEALRQARMLLAQKENVPAYIVFSNATLADMAVKAPRTRAEFLNVSGVGQVKAQRYADAFLKVIAQYQQGR